MKLSIFLAFLLAGAGMLEVLAQQKSPEKIKEWDPTYADKSQVVEWDSRKFKEFGIKGTKALDGRKAMGGKKMQSPEAADSFFSRKADVNQSRPRWLEKDFRTREARIVAKAQEEWSARQLKKEKARGFDSEYRTSQSAFDARTQNRLFQGEDRDSRVMYKGPEAELIKQDLQKASEIIELGDLKEDHKLTIEKIKELLNKP